MPTCGFSWMRSERKRQLDRLWRRRLHQTDEPRARRRFRRLMRGFDDEDLDALCRAVESDGRDARDCAPGPPMEADEASCSNKTQDYGLSGATATAAAANDNDDSEDLLSSTPADQCGLIPQIDRPMSLPYLCCMMWRWEELQVDAALHRLAPLPWCRFGRVTVNGATVSCCNPYHYALWTRHDLPPTVQECSADDNSLPSSTMPNGSLPHNVISYHNNNNNNNPIRRKINRIEETSTYDTGFGDEITATAVEKTSPGGDDDRLAPTHEAWARLARWEMKERIGDLISLVGRVVAVGQLAGSVFDAQHCQDDWDEENEVGFALIRTPQANSKADGEYDDVWLYNYGARPLFTCLSTTGTENSEAIRRVSPGYCILVHSVCTSPRKTSRSSVGSRGAVYLTISSGKGWGLNYHRLFVTECPCRFEVIFN